ncbi:hypothetical protein L7F22_019130 [Adiantum nelumboides]|nr:hypothetical protein [Adiantum nelumboides]
MATPPSPRTRPEQTTAASSSSSSLQNGNKFPSSNYNIAASPSPSPALSAYSYTSSTSSDSDFDLNSLSLDDWGTSKSNRKNSVAPSQSDKSIRAYLSPEYAQSGTTTPVPGSRSSTSDFEKYLRSKASFSSDDKPSSHRDSIDAIEDEDLENEADGFDVEDENEEDMHANGVPAARGWRLDARKSKTPAFQAQVLALFSEQLQIDTWSEQTVNPDLWPLEASRVKLKRISGAFSNAVFFVSYDKQDYTGLYPKTVSFDLYEIGPHILGTFANGRVETYFDAEPIGKDGIRDLGDRRETIKEDGSLLVRGSEGRAQWVARRMRQLHEVPLETMRTVLEQGDLRANGDGSSVFGRGIENHLFARSHRPRMHRNPSSIPQNIIDSSRNLRDSPAPMAEESNNHSSLTAVANEGAQAKAMSIRGFSPHRNNSVASFDSLATSFNSQDSMSMSSENILSSPSFGPTGSAASSYTESVNAVRNARAPSTSPYIPNHRTSSSTKISNGSSQPYPGMWRRSKRWAREAGKVLALVDEFCKTDAGQAACKRALKGTPLEGKDFSPFTSFNDINVPTLELGTTVNSLRTTLLAIASLNFPRFLAEMDAFKAFIRKWEKLNGASRRVLAHGDTQYSNLLLIKEGAFEEENAGKGMPRERSRDSSKPTDSPEISNSRSSSISSNKRRSRSRRAPYERLIVIDFEYCSPNPRAYDIANAFHEWRFDYHHITDCWSPYTFAYPTRDERRRWLRAYVEQGRLLRMRGKAPKVASDSTTAELTDQSINLPPALPSGEDLILPPCVISKETGSEPTPTKSRPFAVSNANVSSRPQSRDSQQVQIGTSSPALNALAGMPSPSVHPTLGGSIGSATDSPRISAARQSPLAYLERSMQKEIDRLEKEVEIFSPACHAAWALWGMTFAKESIETLLRICLQGDYVDPAMASARDAENGAEVIAGSAESFDNLRYTLSRVELFRAELKALGVQVSST